MTAPEGEEDRGAQAPSRDTGPRGKPASIAPPPISIDRLIGGRYRVTRSIGGGGMGHVFEVEHQALGRRFALKVLRVTGWDEELVQRFEREAKALARIGSPRVAQVSDFGVEDGIGPWFVMELVGGQTLQERLDESGAIGTEEGIALAIALCEAVEDVHAQGIVHRDLKPANIGLPPGPIPLKLLDFGLAAGIDDELLTRITKSHQVLGSLPYIAPEQFAGSRPGKAQDLWAMGIVIYEMFTGRLPFEAPSTAALMHKILTAPPPAFDAFPPELREVLDGLLVKDPQRRLPSAKRAAEMLAAIDTDALPDSLELQLPDEEPEGPGEPFTPPFAVTQPTARDGDAAHVLSAAIGVAEEPNIPDTEPPRAPAATRGEAWLWALVLLALMALIGVVAFLILREEPRVDPVVAPVPSPVQEPRELPVPAMREAPRPEAPPVAVMEEEQEPEPPAAMRRRAARRTRMSTSAMDVATESGMDGDMASTPMESPTPMQTMEPSSWMGEIIGEGWGGEIIEGGR